MGRSFIDNWENEREIIFECNKKIICVMQKNKSSLYR